MKLTSDIKLFVTQHESEDIRQLALQSQRYKDIDFGLAIQQIAGRQIAKNKIPTWYSCDDIIYPKHLSLEQCSSEDTARYKSTLTSGQTLVDLTGGMGVDTSFLAAHFGKATYVELQAELADIAVNNFGALALTHIDVVNADAIDYLISMPHADVVYIDPARRDIKGKKTILIEDCTPNILAIEEMLHQKAGTIIVKLSPMLDITLASKSLYSISDIHIISVANECKELLFIKKTGYTGSINLHCINITNDKIDAFSFAKEDEEISEISYSQTVSKYLYEPNASIIKAGAYKSIAIRFGLKKLHPSSHLYTSEQICENFPGRQFTVEAVSSFNKKELKDKIGTLKQANITTRNFPMSVDELRKKTGLKDGGYTYIFATTMADNKKVLIVCRKTES